MERQGSGSELGQTGAKPDYRTQPGKNIFIYYFLKIFLFLKLWQNTPQIRKCCYDVENVTLELTVASYYPKINKNIFNVLLFCLFFSSASFQLLICIFVMLPFTDRELESFIFCSILPTNTLGVQQFGGDGHRI